MFLSKFESIDLASFFDTLLIVPLRRIEILSACHASGVVTNSEWSRLKVFSNLNGLCVKRNGTQTSDFLYLEFHFHKSCKSFLLKTIVDHRRRVLTCGSCFLPLEFCPKTSKLIVPQVSALVANATLLSVDGIGAFDLVSGIVGG